MRCPLAVHVPIYLFLLVPVLAFGGDPARSTGATDRALPDGSIDPPASFTPPFMNLPGMAAPLTAGPAGCTRNSLRISVTPTTMRRRTGTILLPGYGPDPRTAPEGQRRVRRRK